MSIADQKQTFVIPVDDPEGFVRRQPASPQYDQVGIERRQFPNLGVELSVEGKELERAIDIFKKLNGKKRINSDELLMVVRAMGFERISENRS